MRRLAVVLSLGLLCLPAVSRATPELQVFLDPALNPGAFYNTTLEDWVATNNPAIVSAFMHGQDPAENYKLVISTPGFDPVAAGVAEPTINPGGPTSAWQSGNPGLPPHGIFDAFHVVHPFSFDAGDATTIFDVQDTTFNPDGSINTLVGAVAGFRKDFTVAFDPDGLPYHIDLLNMDRTNGPNFVSAPRSHDGSLVPEPHSALVFGIGSLIVGYGIRKRLR
jgi:hypothetical protein